MKKVLTIEERYQIYEDKYVGKDSQKNDGSGQTISRKRSMDNWNCRKWVMTGTKGNDAGEAAKKIAHNWLDEKGIPRHSVDGIYEENFPSGNSISLEYLISFKK